MEIGEIAEALARAQIEHRILEAGDGSRALVSVYGARVLAWEQQGTASNLLWTHPDLTAIRSAEDCDRLRGGPGGVRVWFAPEWMYGWQGEPDAQRFSNYVVQPAACAGKWVLSDLSRRSLSAETHDEIENLQSRERIPFSVERTISLFSTPPTEAGELSTSFSGISVQQRLYMSATTKTGCLDLWNILQVPKGARMLFPVRPDCAPEVYFNASGKRSWVVHDGLVEWKVDGDSETKWGLPVRAVIGRLGALVPGNGGRDHLLVWNHPVQGGMPYPDGPRPDFRGDQVVQSWDGFGFGEVEYHSPAASSELPLILDSSVLWAFTGSAEELAALATRLLRRTILPG